MPIETIKLFTLILATGFIAAEKNPILLIISIGIIIILTATIPKNLGKLLKRIRFLSYSVILIMLFQILFNSSVDIPTRALVGFIQSIKILTISILVFLYTSLTSPSKIGEAFSFLPGKIRLMLTISLSLLPVVVDETEKIRLIQISRGYQTSIWNPFQSIFPIMIPLIHRILRRTEQIALVIQSKGYEMD